MNIVIVNCFDTYESRVELLCEYFTSRGDQVKVYTSDFRHFHKCKRSSAPENFYLIKTKPYKKNLSVGRILSHMRFAKAVRKAVEKQISEVDLLWVMLPPNSLAKQMAGLKSRNNKFKLIYDIIDMWPETMPFHGMEQLPPVKYWRNLRDKNISCADMVVTECKLFQKKITDCVPADKLYNLYFAKKDADIFLGDATDDDKLSLCYMGSINNIVDIDVIGKIIARLSKQKRVKLHIIGDGERREELIQTAQKAGAIVEFHGITYDKDIKAEILSKCHFGLNVMKDSVFVGLTMKSMDYFAAGLPMINNIQGDTWEIIEQNGFGLNYPIDIDRLSAFMETNETRQRIRMFFDDNFSEKAFVSKLDEIMEKVYADRN